jgi:hypothetical protein
MSHFSRIKTQIVEKEFLLKAIQDLGYEYIDGKQKLNGFAGAKAEVDVRIPISLSYDIGFKKTNGQYEIIADWWGVTKIKQKEFSNQLMQRYAYHATIAKLEAKGFTLSNEEETKDGQIRLVLRRMS